MNRYPKVLVISHNAFSSKFNNGKTLISIFKDFPKDNLAQLFFSKNECPDFVFCSKYFKITDIDVLKNLVFFSHNYGTSVVNSSGGLESQQLSKSSFFFDFLKSKNRYLMFFRDVLWKSNRWKTNKLIAWIKNFEPEMIFFVAGSSGFSHDISLWLSKYFEIPLYVYMTDDYLLNPLHSNFFEFVQKKRMFSFYKKTFEASSGRFVIGKMMAEEYSIYFKKEFIPIMNSVEISKTMPVLVDNKDLVVSYFGGLHLNRWKMLIEIGALFDDIASHLGINIEFNVYTNSKISVELRSKMQKASIKLPQPVFGETLKEKMSNSDILVHVESDDVQYRRLTKLSVSTKIPEYLVSSSCILAYGPKEVASMRLIQENEIGVFISSDDNIYKSKKELINLILNRKFRESIQAKAFEFAKKYFDANKNRTLLLNTICKNFKQDGRISG